MTIIVNRRRHESRHEKEMGEIGKQARRAADRKLASMLTFLAAKQKKDTKLKGAAIRRYAKKHNLVLDHHRKPWIFYARSGEKVAMPPGYFTREAGVLEQLVCN